MKNIGVLALQGAFIEHVNIINALGHEALEIRKAEQLDDIDGIILPGGESTTMGKLLNDFNLLQPLKDKITAGLPVWGTCAGMILLAKEIADQDTSYLGTMDIMVKRNAYGRQSGSFDTHHVIPSISKEAIPLVFIRAPYIESAGPNVQILCKIDNHIVAAKQDNIFVTSFHPELTDDFAVHEYFINMIQ